MAIPCLVDRAPCLPARILSISPRTNSPAWVDADFPARLSRRAFSMMRLSGMFSSTRTQPTMRLQEQRGDATLVQDRKARQLARAQAPRSRMLSVRRLPWRTNLVLRHAQRVNAEQTVGPYLERRPPGRVRQGLERLDRIFVAVFSVDGLAGAEVDG